MLKHTRMSRLLLQLLLQPFDESFLDFSSPASSSAVARLQIPPRRYIDPPVRIIGLSNIAAPTFDVKCAS